MSTRILPISESRHDPTARAYFWLLIIVCAVFVVVEGLSRGDSIVYADTGELAILAAGWIFALISLPFVMFYADAAGASKSESLLLWLILGTVIYTKDFAYTHIPGAPLYVTDLVLAVCTYLNRDRITTFARGLPRIQLGALALFIAVGGLCAGRGIVGGQDRLKVARDAELVVYTAFLFLGFVVFHSWPSIRRAITIFFVGSCLSSINAIMWFLGNPGARRYIPYPLYILAAFLGLFILTIRRISSPARFWLAALLGLGILLADARTIYVSLAACIVAIVIVASRLWRGTYLAILKPLLAATVIAAFSALLIYQTKTGADFINRNLDELASGTINYQNDANASFRFLAWLEAYDRFIQHPVIGEGYGVPFTFELADNDSRPHNTYLTVLYKMGMLGFVPLVSFLTIFFVQGYRSLRSGKKTRAASWLLILLIAQLSFCFFGSLNLLLESPFLASVFWLFCGISYSLIVQLENRRDAIPHPVY